MDAAKALSAVFWSAPLKYDDLHAAVVRLDSARAALAQQPGAQDRGDAERMDWICDHATVQGGGDGMTVTFRVPDSEDIRAAIDDARAAKGE
jgi:hypothetical protein